MIKTSTVTIGPKKAKELLELNTQNRPLRARHVRFLAKEMEAGNWALNGESIKVGGKRLIDGQHRLHAIIQSQTPIKVVLMEGINPSVFDTIDTGKIRNNASVLAIRGNDEMLGKLEEYALSEGCEFGEYVYSLIHIGSHCRQSYGASTCFIQAHEKELQRCLQVFETQRTWVTREELVPAATKR